MKRQIYMYNKRKRGNQCAFRQLGRKVKLHEEVISRNSLALLQKDEVRNMRGTQVRIQTGRNRW